MCDLSQLNSPPDVVVIWDCISFVTQVILFSRRESSRSTAYFQRFAAYSTASKLTKSSSFAPTLADYRCVALVVNNLKKGFEEDFSIIECRETRQDSVSRIHDSISPALESAEMLARK